MNKHKFIKPWSSIDEFPPSNKKAIEEEVNKEILKNHPLYGRNLKTIARREDCDDILFQIENSQKVAYVHLTWSSKKEFSDFPITVIYENIEEFKTTKMKDDAKESI